MPRLATSSVAALAALTIVACDQIAAPSDRGGRTGIQFAVDLHMQAGDSQFAIVGRAVSINPVVRVLDDSGRQLQGVTVTFSVTSGGGTATGTTAVSDSAGLARVGSWTLGPTIGTNTLTAEVSGHGDPIVFIATAMCDCWTDKSSLNVPRTQASSAILDGKLYVAGGLDQLHFSLPLESYDPVNDKWTAHALMPQHQKAGLAALNGQLYFVGGELGNGALDTTEATFLESYNPDTDQWTRHTAPPRPRMNFDAAAVGGRLYAFGGMHYAVGNLNTLEVYNPTTDTWTTKAPMLTARRLMGVAVVDGIIYAIGGEGKGPGVECCVALSSVEAYDPATDTWTAKAPLPAPLISGAASVVNGIIYLAGGGQWTYWGGSSYVYAYDPANDKWTVQPPMRTSLSGATAAGLDGTVYVIGGSDGVSGHGMLGSVEAYKP